MSSFVRSTVLKSSKEGYSEVYSILTANLLGKSQPRGAKRELLISFAQRII
jgi:hypothetical protein